MKKIWPIPFLFSLKTLGSSLFIIFVLNIAVFIFDYYQYIPIPNLSFGEGSSRAIFTSLFLHSSLLILAFNMFFFIIWGRRAQNAFGSIRFAVIYFFSGIIANFIFISVFPAESYLLTAIGSAGAVSGVLGSYLFLNERNYHNLMNLRLEDLIHFLIWFSVQFFYFGDIGQIAIVAPVVGVITGLLLSFVFFSSNPVVNMTIKSGKY